MADRFYVGRWAYHRPGFRAKIAAGWFVFDRANPAIPVLGPFPNRRTAVNHLEVPAMTDQKKNPAQSGGSTETERETVRETERTSEKPGNAAGQPASTSSGKSSADNGE